MVSRDGRGLAHRHNVVPPQLSWRRVAPTQAGCFCGATGKTHARRVKGPKAARVYGAGFKVTRLCSKMSVRYGVECPPWGGGTVRLSCCVLLGRLFILCVIIPKHPEEGHGSPHRSPMRHVILRRNTQGGSGFEMSKTMRQSKSSYQTAQDEMPGKQRR